MSVVETILVFVVVPGAMVAVMAALIWGRGSDRGQRYRPGRDWPYEPVWYAPHPLAVPDLSHDDPRRRSPELTSGQSALTPEQPSGPVQTAAGGARGTW
ncbi:MAG: hypothetical protein M3313_07125 [Actinomycetota bacterium]|nr:hypothetical protein [Actinomycetota bacterium]